MRRWSGTCGSKKEARVTAIDYPKDGQLTAFSIRGYCYYLPIWRAFVQIIFYISSYFNYKAVSQPFSDDVKYCIMHIIMLYCRHS